MPETEDLPLFLPEGGDRPRQHNGDFRPFCRLNGQMHPLYRSEPPQPDEEIAPFLAGRAKLTHVYAMMYHSHKIERKLLLSLCTLTNSHHRDRRRPIHIIAISTTTPTIWSLIKGKMAVQCRDMG